MSISLALSSFEWDDRKINLIDTPGEPSFVADALGAMRVCESAIFVVNGVMGVEVSTQPPVGARRGARHRADDLREHARPRAGRLLPRARVAARTPSAAHVVATEIPIGSEHDVSRRHRPHRHEGLRATTATSVDNCTEIPIPDDMQATAEEYREKLMDEICEVSDVAHGALPRGRGDRPRRDRHRAEGRHEPRLAVPGHLRRRDAQPRDEPPARRDRRGPARRR